MASDWLLWQLADSAFPAGGFAHSGGLEAAWQHGLAGRDGLADFLRAAVRQAARGSAPFTAATCREPARFSEADAACDAFLSNHVANRASRAQGQALVTAATRVFRRDALTRFAADARAGRLPIHLAPAFGVVAAALGVDAPAATRLYLFLSLRSLVSAAVRLGIVGPLEAQGIQHDLAADAENAAALAADVSLENVAQTAPLLELVQGAQDRLYSRLFQS